ncbi:hypothetical protein DRH13_00650 [Candidatus Woesebacteria bacterium]|nr:MAG: hypothetical protein DRH13_00650 [Candidatus Woesebacteria bacterium]
MRYVKVFFGFILLAIFVSLFILVPKKLKINNITCQSQFGPCNTSILGLIDKTSNGNKSLDEVKKELHGILANSILISDYSFHFQFPNKIEVNLIERKPKYALKAKGTDSYALVDKEGHVIYFQDLTGLPVLITTEPPPNVGETVSNKTFFALEVLYGMFSSYQVREGKIEDESLVIELSQGPKVIFPLEGENEILLGSLRLVLSKLNNDDQDSKIENVSGASIIDLRFKNPVIK